MKTGPRELRAGPWVWRVVYSSDGVPTHHWERHGVGEVVVARVTWTEGTDSAHWSVWAYPTGERSGVLTASGRRPAPKKEGYLGLPGRPVEATQAAERHLLECGWELLPADPQAIARAAIVAWDQLLEGS